MEKYGRGRYAGADRKYWMFGLFKQIKNIIATACLLTRCKFSWIPEKETISLKQTRN
jgi:hypothetical protein